MSWSVLIGAAASFAALAIVFWPLERAWAARKGQPLGRAGFWTDVCFFFGQHLLWSGLALAALSFVDGGLARVLPSSPREAFAGLPFPAQAVIAVLVGDLVLYGWHRACHTVPLLWRFHAVHHTTPALDWVAAQREHPLDGLTTQLAINGPAMLLGFSMHSLAFIAVFRGLWGVVIHSNAALPVGPLRVLVGAPDLHHWHHARSAPMHNFSNLSPWCDVLFGTYHRPVGPETWPLGIEAPAPTGYLQLLLWPFLPDALARRLGCMGVRGPEEPVATPAVT